MIDLPGAPRVTLIADGLWKLTALEPEQRAGVWHLPGPETVSRFGGGMADGGPQNAKFGDARARTKLRAQGGQPDWTPIDSFPDVYTGMGETAENVAQWANVSREEMDEFAALSQHRAVESQENGFFEREITPVTTPDGTVVGKYRKTCLPRSEISAGLCPGSDYPVFDTRFGKLDESWSYGEIFNLSTKWSLPLSYFSTGQRISPFPFRASKPSARQLRLPTRRRRGPTSRW